MSIFFVDDLNNKLTEITGVNFDGISDGWSSTFNCRIKYETEEEGKAVSVASVCVFNNHDLPTDYLSDFLQVVLIVGGQSFKKVSFREWKKHPFNFVMVPNEIVEVSLNFSVKKGAIKDSVQRSGIFDFDFGIFE